MRKRFISCAALALASGFASADLVSHYRGENNANDSVGLNHGQTAGVVNYTAGVAGQAFLFPDDGHISIPNPAAGGLVSPTGFTVAAWIRLDGADPPPQGGPGAIISYGADGSANGFVVAQSGSSGDASPIAFLVATGGGPNPFTVVNTDFPWWNLGQVYHLAATFDAATHAMVLYRDGEVVGSNFNVPGTAMVTSPTGTFVLGRDIRNGAAFEGMLDEVRFYNHALSATDVAALIPESAASCAILAGLAPTFARRRNARRFS